MARIAKLGIAPGAEFPWASFEPAVQEAIAAGVKAGQQAIHDQEAHLGEHVNGWQITLDMGRYGTRYAYRAAWTFFGVGGNLIEDACYPLATTDGDGEPLDSSHRYRLHFDASAVASGERVLVADHVRPRELPRRQRHRPLRARRPQRPDLRRRRLAHPPPPDASGPTPHRRRTGCPPRSDGAFKVALRLYSPKPDVAQGSWQPPPIERVD